MCLIISDILECDYKECQTPEAVLPLRWQPWIGSVVPVCRNYERGLHSNGL